MSCVPILEAQASFLEILNKVATGETIIITRDGMPIAQVLPIQQPKAQPQFGSCRGMITIVSDDDEHLEHFKEYVP